jgi:hypothetical protein
MKWRRKSVELKEEAEKGESGSFAAEIRQKNNRTLSKQWQQNNNFFLALPSRMDSLDRRLIWGRTKLPKGIR